MNLYVGNLSRTVTEADLGIIFQGFGQVVFACLAPAADDHRARGYALVAVADKRQAERAVSTMNGKYLKGLRLIVRPVLDPARMARALKAHKALSGPWEAPAPLSAPEGTRALD